MFTFYFIARNKILINKNIQIIHLRNNRKSLNGIKKFSAGQGEGKYKIYRVCAMKCKQNF